MSVLKSNDSLMLRKINPVDILSRYYNGEFINLKIPSSKIVASSNFVSIAKQTGTSHDFEIYRFNDKGNNSQLIVTTNHESYSNYVDPNKKELRNNKCGYCRREIKNVPIGIPLKMEIIGNKKIFHVDDYTCNFSCALSFLIKEQGISHFCREPLYMDSEQLLHCLYYEVYPNKRGHRIKEAKHWRLLDENNGPLSSEEYDKDTYEYIEIPNIAIVPSKRQFLKLGSK